MPASPAGAKSPDGPKSPSDVGSNIGSPDHHEQYLSAPSGGEGPKTPQSPSSVARSPPGSPEARSRPASPDSASQAASPARNPDRRSHSMSPSPDRNTSHLPMVKSPMARSPNDQWRRHTKAEQKMVPVSRNRSRSDSSQSSKSSSYNKRSSMKDPATEEISEGILFL